MAEASRLHPDPPDPPDPPDGTTGAGTECRVGDLLKCREVLIEGSSALIGEGHICAWAEVTLVR